MGDLILQVLAYSGVGLVILFVALFVMDLLIPGNLATMVAEGNRGGGIVSASTSVSLGLVLWFAIYFTGAGWSGLLDAAVFGAIAVAIQAAGFLIYDLLAPGKLGRQCCAEGPTVPAAAWAIAGWQIAVALIVSASLT